MWVVQFWRWHFACGAPSSKKTKMRKTHQQSLSRYDLVMLDPQTLLWAVRIKGLFSYAVSLRRSKHASMHTWCPHTFSSQDINSAILGEILLFDPPHNHDLQNLLGLEALESMCRFQLLWTSHTDKGRMCKHWRHTETHGATQDMTKQSYLMLWNWERWELSSSYLAKLLSISSMSRCTRLAVIQK